MHRRTALGLLALSPAACSRAAIQGPPAAPTSRAGCAYALMIRAAEAELERMLPLRVQLACALLVRYGALPEAAAGGRTM